MAHIRIWPENLNYPHQSTMFAEKLAEWGFWGHLYSCPRCRKKLSGRFPEETELKEKGFWQEVKKYLERKHPDIVLFRNMIVGQSKLDLSLNRSGETVQEFAEIHRAVNYHLLICGMCSSRFETIYERLKDHDRMVKAAARKWEESSA